VDEDRLKVTFDKSLSKLMVLPPTDTIIPTRANSLTVLPIWFKQMKMPEQMERQQIRIVDETDSEEEVPSRILLTAIVNLHSCVLHR